MKRIITKIITVVLCVCMMFAFCAQPYHGFVAVGTTVACALTAIGMMFGVGFLSEQINSGKFVGGFWNTKVGEYIAEGNAWDVNEADIEVINNKMILQSNTWQDLATFWNWLLDDLGNEGNETTFPIDQTNTYNGLPLFDGSTLIVPSSGIFGNSLQFQTAANFLQSLSTSPTYMSFFQTYVMANENTLRVDLGTYGNDSNCTLLYINDSLWGHSGPWPSSYSYTGNEFIVVDNTYNNNRLAFCREAINGSNELGFVRQDLLGPNGGYMVVRGAWTTQLGYGETTIQERLGISTTTDTEIVYPTAVDDALILNPGISAPIGQVGFLDAVLAGTATITGTITDAASAGNIANLDNIGNYQSPGLQSVFPFCIPFDVYNFIGLLRAERQAPHFEWRFQLRDLVDYTFVIDLSSFNTVATVLRTMELLGFIVGLAMVTRRMIKW